MSLLKEGRLIEDREHGAPIGERGRILIHSHYPLRKDTPNGVANFVLEIVPYLRGEGYSVRLVAPAISDDEQNLADFTLGIPVRMRHHATVIESSWSFNKGLARRLALTIRPDIVDFHEPIAGIGAHTLLSGLPKRSDGKVFPATVAHFHARTEALDWKWRLSFEVGKRLRRIKYNQWGFPKGLTPGYINTVMQDLDGKVAVSNATARFWNDIYPGEFAVIYNGIDVGELTPDGPVFEEWQDGKKTLLFTGRHDVRKGLQYLVEAYERLTNSGFLVKLKITGNGQETERLQGYIQEHGIADVEFLGVLSRDDLIKAYRSADVFVSPAIEGEGFGRTLAEALSCGTLTVGSNISGYDEVIGYRPFARMAEKKNSHDLAEKIAEFLNLPKEEVNQLGREASDYVRRRFAWETIASQTAAYYDRSIENHGRPKEQWPKKRLERKGTVFLAEWMGM